MVIVRLMLMLMIMLMPMAMLMLMKQQCLKRNKPQPENCSIARHRSEIMSASCATQLPLDAPMRVCLVIIDGIADTGSCTPLQEVRIQSGYCSRVLFERTLAGSHTLLGRHRPRRC